MVKRRSAQVDHGRQANQGKEVNWEKRTASDLTVPQRSLTGLSPVFFNARREALIIELAYHSLLKLDTSGETQISPSIYIYIYDERLKCQ